jgi:hypothetical protein
MDIYGRKQGKGMVAGRASHFIAGTTTHLVRMPQIVLAGRTYTPAELVEKLQGLVDLRREVEAARAMVKAKLVIEKAEAPALRDLLATLALFVKATFANQPDVLADFGLHLKTPAVLSAEEKTAAAAKRAATRKARHTMGAKQRKRIKGDVVGIHVTHVTSPAEPSPAEATTDEAAGPTIPATSTAARARG